MLLKLYYFQVLLQVPINLLWHKGFSSKEYLDLPGIYSLVGRSHIDKMSFM